MRVPFVRGKSFAMTTILVVDDAELDQLLAGECVERHGLKPIYASNGREALEVIAQEKPDIVLTDLQMPEMDGLELVRKIRTDYPKLPAMVMTARGSEQIAMAALNAGAASYVPKNNLVDNLREALRVILTAVEATKNQEQVRDFLIHSQSSYILGYQENGPTALGYSSAAGTVTAELLRQDHVVSGKYCCDRGIVQCH